MMNDDAIFGPRPDSGRIAQPPPHVLNEFLERTYKESVHETHATDVIRYRKPLYHLENFENRMHAIEARPSAGEQALFGALLHTRFFNRSLLLAVGQYKFHLHELLSIDFESPKRFIESAEITSRKLSKRKINDVIRMGRLQEMVDERKKLMDKHRTRWGDLTMELLDIALYVLENLVKIDRLCGRVAGFLREQDLSEKKEMQLVEEIKVLYKGQLRDALGYRTVTTEDIARAKQEVSVLARELHYGIMADIGRMSGIYDQVRSHVKRCADELDELLGTFRGNEIEMDHEQVLQFRRIEQVLVTLVTGYPEQIDPTGDRPGTSRSFIVEDKRQEMVAYLINEARKDPGTRIERRSKKERRKGKDPNYAGPERRNGKERRK
jgi:hypothetical protein